MGKYHTIGHQFEEFVCYWLWKLGLNAVRTEARSSEDANDKVDLIVSNHEGLRFEIQITLRSHDGYKIATFARVALLNVDRGIRVYVEACTRQKGGLRSMGRKAAHAIRTLFRAEETFGEHALVGIRVKPDGTAQRFDPCRSIRRNERALLLERRARALFNRWIDTILIVEELPMSVPSPTVETRPAPCKPSWMQIAWTPERHAPESRDIHPNHRASRVSHRPYHALLRPAA